MVQISRETQAIIDSLSDPVLIIGPRMGRILDESLVALGVGLGLLRCADGHFC